MSFNIEDLTVAEIAALGSKPKPNLSTNFQKYEFTKGVLVIGDNRLVMPDFPGIGSVDLVLTDPPYKGVSPITGFDALKAKTERVAISDVDYGNRDIEFDEWIPKAAATLKQSGTIVIFEDAENVFTLHDAVVNAKLRYGGLGVWYIPNKFSGKGDHPLTSYEIWMWAHKSSTNFYNRDVLLHDVLNESKSNADDTHSEGKKIFGKKPLSILKNIIEAFTPQDGKILDCFMGSGSTMAACVETHRYCYGIEIDPELKDVITKKSNVDTKSLFEFSTGGDDT